MQQQPPNSHPVSTTTPYLDEMGLNQTSRLEMDHEIQQAIQMASNINTRLGVNEEEANNGDLEVEELVNKSLSSAKPSIPALPVPTPPPTVESFSVKSRFTNAISKYVPTFRISPTVVQKGKEGLILFLLIVVSHLPQVLTALTRVLPSSVKSIKWSTTIVVSLLVTIVYLVVSTHMFVESSSCRMR